MKNIKIFLVGVPLFLPLGWAYAQTVPSGVAINLTDIIDLAKDIGGFLMVLGGILAPIAIIVSGIAYLVAGSDPNKVKRAKDILKAGIIGALIIFSVGVIIASVRGLASNPFQFFGGGVCTDYGGGSWECVGGPNAGNPCVTNADC